MSEIQQLSQESSRLLSSSIIITSVFSVAKELIENSLDAGATNIEVKLENHGLEKIEVRDNGVGIRRGDIPSVAKSHFTSKISSFSDLEVLESYGFRGEALSAICAISGLNITTKTAEDDISMTYTFDKAGDIISSKPSASPSGTTISVLNLFNNIPVRKKYYKSEKHRKDEVKKIEDLLCAYACAQIETRFALFHNRNLIWQKTATPELKAALIQVFGSSNVNNLEYKSEDCEGNIKIEAFLPRKTAPVFYVSRTTCDRTIVAINKRPVKIKAIEKLLQDTYCHCDASDDSRNRFPICYLSITVPPSQLDVNIDPNKSQVLLHNFEEVLNLLSTFLKTIPVDQNCRMQDVPISNTSAKCSTSSVAEIHRRKSNENSLKSTCDLNPMEKSRFSINEAALVDSILGHEKVVDTVPSVQIHETIDQNLKEPHENLNFHKSGVINIAKNKTSHSVLSDTVVPQGPCERFILPEKKISMPSNIEKSKCSTSSAPSLQSKLSKSHACVQRQISKDNDLKDISDFFSINSKNSSVNSEKMLTECLFSSEKPNLPNPCKEIATAALNFHPVPKVPCSVDENIPPLSDFIVSPVNEKKDLAPQSKSNSDSEWAHGKVPDAAGNILKPVSILVPRSPKNKRCVETEAVSRDQKKQKVVTENNKDKDSNRPASAFDFFCRDNRLEVAAQNPGCDNKEIARILFEQWKTLSSEKQNRYIQLAQKQGSSKQKGLKNKTLNSGSKSPIKHTKNKTYITKSKNKEIPFKIEELRKMTSRSMCIADDSVSENLVPIKSLSSGVWVCRRNYNLLLLNTFRMRETLLFHRLLETYQLKADALQEPVVITPESLGDPGSYNMLLFLCMKENSTEISNVCMVSNGFNIRFSKENCIAQLVGLSSLISSYGLQDLREILCLLKNNENQLLAKCRPFKVIHYLQGEAVRIARQSLAVQRRDEFLDLYCQTQKYLGDISACFHNRAFQHQLFDLNELQQKQKAISVDESVSLQSEL